MSVRSSTFSSPGIVPSTAARNRRLVVYFDINNTIISKDPSAGITSVKVNVATNITKMAWGRVIESDQPEKEADDKQEDKENADPNVQSAERIPPTWQLVSEELSWKKPVLQDAVVGLDTIKNYHDFLREAYPTQVGDHIAEAKAAILEKTMSFTNPGELGQKFKKMQDKLMKCLNLPQGAKACYNFPDEMEEKIVNGEPLWNDEPSEKDPEDEDAEFEDTGEEKQGPPKLTEEEKRRMLMFGEGKYHILPSFFRTLIFLKKQRRDFNVCFRTFGNDLDNIVWEFNEFCCGNHPCFNGKNGTPLIRFDGTQGTRDLRIRESTQKGCFIRLSCDLKDTKFVQGTYERPNIEFEDLSQEMSQEKYEDCSLHSSPAGQFKTIQKTLTNYGSMAIQDDYANWKENEYHREVAKILHVDPNDHFTQHIFFDDSAHEDDDCVVDVRNVATEEIVPWKKFINRSVIKADPNKAILEPDYFIKMIELAEKNRTKEIERAEAGIVEEEVEEKKVEVDEWELLQSLDDEEYLMKTILPVLHQGMKQVEQQRPVAPVEYLAIYLLKNQHLIKLPPKPAAMQDKQAEATKDQQE